MTTPTPPASCESRSTLDSTPPLFGEAGAVGVRHEDGSTTAGWSTPSRKLEVYSTAMRDWGWSEHATPGYIPSHVARSQIDLDAGDLVLIPTFRLPTLIHTRSGNAKYLNEISNTHPLWLNSVDAARHGVATGDLVRLYTSIGHLVARVWVTEGIRPGCARSPTTWAAGACTTPRAAGGCRGWSTSPIPTGRTRGGCATAAGWSPSPPTTRTRSGSGGPTPACTRTSRSGSSPTRGRGMHCWLQKVRLEPARADDRYGDVYVDADRSQQVYRDWLAKTRPRVGPGDNDDPSSRCGRSSRSDVPS